MLLHNSHDKFFRTPYGPVKAGEQVTFRFLCDHAEKIQLRLWMNGLTLCEMEKTNHIEWSGTIQVPQQPGLGWYDFVITLTDGTTLYYGTSATQDGGEGMVWPEGDMKSFQLVVYDPRYHTPRFMHGANIYQIFPDRFYHAQTEAKDKRTDRHIHKNWDEDLLTDSDPRSGDHMALDFFGGNLNGIREKLPYLKQMGVDVIYLNPIFQARSNHRYDTGDYTKVDPLLGTEQEFTALCDAARDMGMSVMLDGVFSHTGEDSLYFNRYGRYRSVGAYRGEISKYYEWFTFEKFPEKYKCWWGIPSLPTVNKDNADYQKFMFAPKKGIVPRWIHAGASGWRLDVADELSMDFLRKTRQAIKKANPEAVILGEVWQDASNKVSYGEMRCYCSGDTLDSVMNYPLREAIINFVTGKGTAADLARLICRQAEVYPVPFRYALMNLIGSHDRARVLNVLCGRDGVGLSKDEQHSLKLTDEEYSLAVQRFKLCVDILCALPGCPTIYYGDEAGMTGCADPFCRRPFPWGKEDTALQNYVREKLTERRTSATLRTGECDVEVLDDDTIRIIRTCTDVDAFGEPSVPETRIYTFKREK